MCTKRLAWILSVTLIMGFGTAVAADGQHVETFLVFQPVQQQTVTNAAGSVDAFAGLTNEEMIDALYEIASKTTCDWSPQDGSEVAFGDGMLSDLKDEPASKAMRRPVLPPGLLLAAMAAEALNALESGTCTHCFFGENDVTLRRGFDLRWKVPIEGIPNAILSSGFEDIPVDPGTVSELPPDPDMVVDTTSSIISYVLSNPSVVIDSYYESGGGVIFYYAFTYDLGEGTRAFATWEFRVLEVK